MGRKQNRRYLGEWDEGTLTRLRNVARLLREGTGGSWTRFQVVATARVKEVLLVEEGG